MNQNTIVGLIIYLLVPLIGVFSFLRIIWKMKNDNIEKSPIIELFIIFVTYGGLLIVALTEFFWKWSAIASIGTFYLIIVAPIAMGIIAKRQFKNKENSKFHLWAYKSGLLYFIIAPITVGITFLIEGIR